MKKYVFISLCLFFFISLGAEEAVDQKEPRFFLIFNLLKTSGPSPGAKIDLYEKPKENSKVLTIKNKKKGFDRIKILKRFHESKEPFESIVTTSTEKKKPFL